MSKPLDSAFEAPLLSTGEMARRSRNTLRAVRFYEEEGILRATRRTEGGHRLFDLVELERLMLVTDMRVAGLSLEEIKQILDVKQASSIGGDAAKLATEILSRQVDELREKLTVLTRLKEDFGQASEIMSGCTSCRDARFPSRCESCAVIASRPTLPRSLRVLWSDVGGRSGR